MEYFARLKSMVIVDNMVGRRIYGCIQESKLVGEKGRDKDTLVFNQWFVKNMLSMNWVGIIVD